MTALIILVTVQLVVLIGVLVCDVIAVHTIISGGRPTIMDGEYAGKKLSPKINKKIKRDSLEPQYIGIPDDEELY